MNKKIIAVICVMLVVTFIFVGCAKKNKIFTDVEGKTHIAYTDENGETVTNEDGDVYVVPTENDGKYVTEEDGSIVTQIADQKDVLTNKSGDQINTIGYTLNLPEGWKIVNDSSSLELKKEGLDNSAIVQVNFDKGTSEDIERRVEEFRNALKGSSIVEQNFTEKDITLKDGQIKNAKEINIFAEKGEGDSKLSMYIHSYIFVKGNFVYGISCIADSEKDMNSLNINEIINNLTFK